MIYKVLCDLALACPTCSICHNCPVPRYARIKLDLFQFLDCVTLSFFLCIGTCCSLCLEHTASSNQLLLNFEGLAEISHSIWELTTSQQFSQWRWYNHLFILVGDRSWVSHFPFHHQVLTYKRYTLNMQWWISHSSFLNIIIFSQDEFDSSLKIVK